MERAVLLGADLAIAVSDEVERQDRRHGARRTARRGRQRCRGGAVPRAALHGRTLVASLGLPLGVPMAAFVGALRPWHGVDIAIDAIAHDPDLHLVVAGDGPIRTDLAQHAVRRSAWPIACHFLGHVDHTGVAATLAAADVAVAPYPALESFSFSPLKLYEYLAAGTPVVASSHRPDPRGAGRRSLGHPRPSRRRRRHSPTALSSAASDPAPLVRAADARRYALTHHGWGQRARTIIELVASLDPERLEHVHALA